MNCKEYITLQSLHIGTLHGPFHLLLISFHSSLAKRSANIIKVIRFISMNPNRLFICKCFPIYISILHSADKSRVYCKEVSDNTTSIYVIQRKHSYARCFLKICSSNGIITLCKYFITIRI